MPASGPLDSADLFLETSFSRYGANPKQIPAERGIYRLILACTTPAEITIGKLGILKLQPGYLVYSGSALGSGGLRARLSRHLRSAKRYHWHIDYLLAHPAITIVDIWAMPLDTRQAQLAAQSPRLECRSHAALGGVPAPLARFGAGDCRCATHLSLFATSPVQAEM